MDQQSRINHYQYRKAFGWLLLVLEVIVIFFYAFFVRVDIQATKPQELTLTLTNSNTKDTFTTTTTTDSTLNEKFYPAYQDVNVMMLIGFGFLMTFIRTYSWSALTFTFLLNAIVVQYYLLFSQFWGRVFHGGWNNNILITQKSLTAASYCVAAILISLGGVLGRLGPLQLLVMAVIQCFAYCFNQKIVYDLLLLYDAGGSTAIHTFAAYFGLTVSFLICLKVKPSKKMETNYSSNIFAFIGTLFLWMFWPSFNAGYFSQTQFQKSVIITNTVIALTASCLSSLMLSALLSDRFRVQDILNATLAGGVAIGAPSGLITNPSASLVIGFLAGIVSVLGYHYLTERLQKSIGLYDTCGIHNLHGMPGLLGGLSSAVVVAAYGSYPLDLDKQQQLPFYNSIHFNRTFNAQGGIQVAGTFASFGIGIGTGIVAGLILNWMYILKNAQFYFDEVEFQLPAFRGKAGLEIVDSGDIIFRSKQSPAQLSKEHLQSQS